MIFDFIDFLYNSDKLDSSIVFEPSECSLRDLCENADLKLLGVDILLC